MKKPLIRVTQLEAFRRYIEQSEYANYEITEQSVIESITGVFEGNTYTKIGSAFHKIVEEGTPQCEKVEAGDVRLRLRHDNLDDSARVLATSLEDFGGGASTAGVRVLMNSAR